MADEMVTFGAVRGKLSVHPYVANPDLGRAVVPPDLKWVWRRVGGGKAEVEYVAPVSYRGVVIDGSKSAGSQTIRGHEAAIFTGALASEGFDDGDERISPDTHLIYAGVRSLTVSTPQGKGVTVVVRDRDHEKHITESRGHPMIKFLDGKLDVEGSGGIFCPKDCSTTVLQYDDSELAAAASREFDRVMSQRRLRGEGSDYVRAELLRAIEMGKSGKTPVHTRDERDFKSYELPKSPGFQKRLKQVLNQNDGENVRTMTELGILFNTEHECLNYSSFKEYMERDENRKKPLIKLTVPDNEEGEENLKEFLTPPEPRTGIIGSFDLPVSIYHLPGEHLEGNQGTLLVKAEVVAFYTKPARGEEDEDGDEDDEDTADPQLGDDDEDDDYLGR